MDRLWFEDDVSIGSNRKKTELNIKLAVGRHGKLWCSSQFIYQDLWACSMLHPNDVSAGKRHVNEKVCFWMFTVSRSL